MSPERSARSVLGYLMFVVVAVLIAAGITFVYTSLATKVYTADAQLVVVAGLGMDTSGTGDVLTAPRIAQTYASLGVTRPVLQEVIVRAELPYDPTELLDHLKVSADPASPFVTIAATDPSAAQAASTANALADILVQRASAPAIPATPTTPAVPRQDILQIVERASIPVEASGPRVLLNTALAAVAAFVIALALVAGILYVREVQGPRRSADLG